MTASSRISLVCALVIASSTETTSAQIRLVNMIPNNRSGETVNDAEPTITVDPLHRSHLAGSAFTWDNLTGGPNVTATAPIYVSSNNGNTWTLAFIVPTKIGGSFPTGDITLNFSSTLSGTPGNQSWLYGGILSTAGAGLPMVVLRTADPFVSTAMTVLDTRAGSVDQPHTTARTSGSAIRLYVGYNDLNQCFSDAGRTSTVDVSQDATGATPTFTADVIDARNTPCQDGFAQVVAPHHDGTVYAAFIHDFNATPRLVVVRDDNWASGASPFTALQDASDATAGRFVTAGLTLASGWMGQQRLGASNVSIAVDPTNSDRVCVTWGDSNGANSETIHLRCSTNRGADWSTDLMTITNALNPEVAINSLGVVGLLYQTLNGGNWETRFTRSTDLDATTFDTPGTLLANQNAATPLRNYLVYIGDYASLVADGRNFVGMFSASNYPDDANFAPGVKYGREVDWATHKLYADVAHTTEVAPSIDPFFFSVPLSACDRARAFCHICEVKPSACTPLFDPWWWLKCPACRLTILVNPGDLVTRVQVFDSEGKHVGALRRLPRPIVEKGVRYTHAISVTSRQGVGYVLRAESKSIEEFAPRYTVRVERQ